MDSQALFNDLLGQISTGQGTFRESGEQGKVLMDIVRQLPEQQQLASLRAYLDVILRETFNIVAARQYCNEFCQTVVLLSPGLQKEIIPYALDKIQSRTISFEEQIFALRMRLADELQNGDQDWIQAAKVLSLIPLDSGQKQYAKGVKLDIYMRIGQLYLEAEEYIEAENFIQRVGMLMDSETPEDFRIRHSASFARIQDFRRKYIEASQRYYDLSRRPGVADSERQTALSSAVNCILLASVSPQRNRVLAILLKDERTMDLPTYGFLRKIFDGKTVKRAEVEQFAQKLAPHQRDALTADGSSLLERTVLEHNILSSRKYFSVASFDALSRLLDMPADRLEKIMVNMASEGRLQVKINHKDNSVTFEQEHPINAWDTRLEQICKQVNKTADLLAAKYPEWYEKNSAAVENQ
ncbi:COP9 signalosome complex subunit 4 [Hypsibius exemplaris]|uniref:COP9 signalosome complex subunit 4 n=1 Tax=Hypsibius exemplaris TaxID=2072580 RepID=A0A1W0WM81_HYPEX|nr:COP9 signalosome complex subunit 4 [Hypsibius exemplaris]